MSEKKDWKTQNLCFDALVEIFTQNTIVFEKGGNLKEDEKAALKEYFDLTLKYIYNNFVDNLKRGLNDELEFFWKLCLGMLG